ncbi:MAG: glycoside hydrolase family 38 N-terminal domain-containing protein [Planctomycetota bacterium]|jgi:alpha-mannosidase
MAMLALGGAAAAGTDIEPSSDWLEGFARAVTGQRISYHSTRIDCTEALITRATTGDMAIAWETAPVCKDWRGGGATFFWLAGMDLADERRRFDVLVDGKKRFEVHTGRQGRWTVESPEGGRLEFDVVKRDEHADGFGYARLHAPPAWLTPGRPLTVEVVGEAAGSRLWFMTFVCPDALAYYREKQRQEGTLDLRLELGRRGAKLSLAGPHPWPNRRLRARPGDGESPESLVMTLDGEDLAVIAPGPHAIDQRQVSGDRIVHVQSPGLEGRVQAVRIRVSYEPQLVRRLRSLHGVALGGGEIFLISSSHQDIAWMDSPQQCIADRDERLITPLLERLERDPAFAYDMENVLCLREYLQRHPERKARIAKYMRQGRLTWGASYNAPYEEMYGGEALVRQFHQGRLWLTREFPDSDTVTYWNVDVPGRTLQMPQILAKSGVRHTIISRHAPGLFRWLAPDGSAVNVYSSGHYADAFRHLNRDFTEAAAYIADAAATWPQTSPVPILSAWDAASPDVHEGLLDDWRTLGPQVPPISYTTATAFMDRAAAASGQWPSLGGERPNVWVYIHGPSHHRAITAAREGQIALTQAETFSTVEALLADSFAEYPQRELTDAWSAAIYPDHGWGGKHGEITDALFREKLEHARDEGRRIRDQALDQIARRISSLPDRGQPVAVFNSLSWARTGPVVCDVPAGTDDGLEIIVTDGEGREIPSQDVAATAFDGVPAPRRIIFIAQQVPPIGYRTYYLQTTPGRDGTWTELQPSAPIETPFYRIDLAPGGVAQIHDKQLGVDLLRTDHLRGGELFTLASGGNGAGEFADVQQPTMDGFDRLRDHGPSWKVVETGPVRYAVRAAAKLEHVTAVITLEVYRTIKRIDERVALMNWDGTPYREFRLAFPAGLDSGRVAYEVPFGVVEVGADEMPGAAGERYVTPNASVRPRGIGRWIGVSNDRCGLTLASSVAVVDFRDATRPDRDDVMLQPVLLASRRSCHAEGPLYAQAGDHHFHFALSSHEPGRANAARFGLAAAEPLLPVLVPVGSTGQLPESGEFLSTDAPDVFVSTLKKCEHDESAILRLYNLAGGTTDAKVRLFWRFERAERTDLLETPSAPVPTSGNTIAVEMGAWAIETVRIR